jgi:hypothetical protein
LKKKIVKARNKTRSLRIYRYERQQQEQRQGLSTVCIPPFATAKDAHLDGSGWQKKATTTADPYGMTTRKARATATTTADPYGMTTRKQGQPQRQQQIPSEMTARKVRTTAKASPPIVRLQARLS